MPWDPQDTAAPGTVQGELHSSAPFARSLAGCAGRAERDLRAPPPLPRPVDDSHRASSYQRLADSYQRQIAAARDREDRGEIERIRAEYTVFLEAWRAGEELARLFSVEFELDQVRSLPEELRPRVRSLLTATEALSSSFPEERMVRADALFLLGELQSASHVYGQLVGLLPDQARLHRHRGLCLQKLGAFEQALSAFERALEIEPHHPSALCGKGVCLSRLGELDEGLIFLNRSLEFAPSQAETHFQVGELLTLLGRAQSASMAYQRALECTPDEPRYVHRQVRSLLSLGHVDAALEALDRAFDQDAFPLAEVARVPGRAPESRNETGPAGAARSTPRRSPVGNAAPHRRPRSYGRRRRRRASPWFLVGALALATVLGVVLNDYLRNRHFADRVNHRPAVEAPLPVGGEE